MRNKKVFKWLMVISFVFILISISNLLACIPPQPEVVAENPFPWSYWKAIDDGVQDIIVLYEDYDQSVFITRQWVTLNESIELSDLTWEGTESINWTGSDEDPVLLEPGGTVALNISTTVADAAVVVRYSVATVTDPDNVVVRFIEEGVFEGGEIIPLFNFDVYNNTGEEVDNFELELYGNITAADIDVWFAGWGTPATVTTVTGVGVEIMWKDTANPINATSPHNHEHFGVALKSNVGQLGAQGFWTKTS
jgi:hypothetical protein